MLIFTSSSFLVIAAILVSYADVAASTETVDYYNKNQCKPGHHRVRNPSPYTDKRSPDIWYYKIPTTIRLKGEDKDEDDNKKSMSSLQV